MIIDLWLGLSSLQIHSNLLFIAGAGSITISYGFSSACSIYCDSRIYHKHPQAIALIWISLSLQHWNTIEIIKASTSSFTLTEYCRYVFKHYFLCFLWICRKFLEDFCNNTIVCSPTEIIINSMPRSIFFRESTPWWTRSQNPYYSIH